MNYKALILESGKKMAASGLTVETWGNISAYDPESGLVYLTPSAMAYDTIAEDDIVACRLSDGSVAEGFRKPTVEKDLHLMIYRARPEVRAILHTHPIYSTVYAAQEKSIPIFLDEAAQALGDAVRCARYALPGTIELAENCVEALGTEANACLLHSHGAVCVGEDMAKAFKVANVLEMTAKIFYLIESSGGWPAGISPDDIEYMKDFAKNHYGQGK